MFKAPPPPPAVISPRLTFTIKVSRATAVTDIITFQEETKRQIGLRTFAHIFFFFCRKRIFARHRTLITGLHKCLAATPMALSFEKHPSLVRANLVPLKANSDWRTKHFSVSLYTVFPKPLRKEHTHLQEWGFHKENTRKNHKGIPWIWILQLVLV